MLSTHSLIRTLPAGMLLATAMASHGAMAVTAIPTINCHGIAMQNACKQQETCIDDPRRLSKDFALSLSLTKKTYTMGDITGNIIPIDGDGAGIRKFRLNPAIQGGTKLEISAHGEKAKLAGGDYNYFFQCRRTRR